VGDEDKTMSEYWER